MKQITYREEIIKVRDLIENQRNEILDFLKNTSAHYSCETNAFSHYEIPVVTEDYMVLSHLNDIYAAHTNQVQEMKVMVAIGLDVDDAIRFVFKSVFFTRYDDEAKKNLIHILTDYLQNNPKGIEWSEELKKNGNKDINEMLGTILNCHKETIKFSKRKNNMLKTETLNFEMPKLSFSIDDSIVKIKYDDKEAILSESDYKIIPKSDSITFKISLKKLGFIIKENINHI